MRKMSVIAGGKFSKAGKLYETSPLMNPPKNFVTPIKASIMSIFLNNLSLVEAYKVFFLFVFRK